MKQSFNYAIGFRRSRSERQARESWGLVSMNAMLLATILVAAKAML